MPYRTVFDERFSEDAFLAKAWYESEQPGLGDEFEAELHNCILRIMERPLTFRRVRGETRRALVNRFQYTVIFRVDDDLIKIAGVFHTSRDRSIWDSRG